MLVVALAYIGIAGQVIVRRQAADATGRRLILYAGLAAAWAALIAGRDFGRLATWPFDLMAQLHLYEALTLGVVFLDLSSAFLHVPAHAQRWYGLGAFWLVVVVARPLIVRRTSRPLRTVPHARFVVCVVG
jgi:hypothetical protein